MIIYDNIFYPIHIISLFCLGYKYEPGRFVKLIAVEKYKEAINILAIRFVAEQLTAVKYTHFVANE